MKNAFSIGIAAIAGFALVSSACNPAKSSDENGSDGDTPGSGIPVTIFMHSEDSNHANTPDFAVASDASLTARTHAYRSYVGFRRVLVSFATLMHDAGIAWDFQPDWNFTLGVLTYEVDSYTAPTASDIPAVSTLLAESGGKNIYRYLVEDLGVQIDPHSHEGKPMGGDDYNYADVACLISATGVTPSGIVGGHTIQSSGTVAWQQWPRFRSALAGTEAHSGDSHIGADCSWTATALMGGGTGNHTTEDSGSGVWLPTVPDDWETTNTSVSATFAPFYWQIDASGAQPLPAIGSYEADYLDTLQGEIDDGTLPSTELFNATQVFNHSDLAQAAYGTLSGSNKYITNLDTFDTPATGSGIGPDAAAQQYFDDTVQPLMDRQSAGTIRLVPYNDVLSIWADEYSSRPNLCVAQSESADQTCDAVE